MCVCCCFFVYFFFQAEDGIRDLVRSRGLGDVYKRQPTSLGVPVLPEVGITYARSSGLGLVKAISVASVDATPCLLYTSDAADERSSVDLGGRRIIKKKIA